MNRNTDKNYEVCLQITSRFGLLKVIVSVKRTRVLENISEILTVSSPFTLFHYVLNKIFFSFANKMTVIQSHHAWKLCSNYSGIKLEPAPGTYKKTKLNICHHMLTSSTQLQNRWFHVVENVNHVFKMSKHKKCTCKNTRFHCQICKFVGFLLPSSSWLLKFPILLCYTLVVSEPGTETASEHSACQDSGLTQIFKLIVSTREKILDNMDRVEWRQVK